MLFLACYVDIKRFCALIDARENVAGPELARGDLVLVGISPMGTGTNFPSALLTRQEKRVAGCYYGSANPARDFPHYAQLYLDGRLDLDRLISKTYALEDINLAYADLLDGKLARGVILL